MLNGRNDRRERMAALLAARSGAERECLIRSAPIATPVGTDAERAVQGRSGHVVLNSGEVVPIRYAVVEAAWLITLT